MQKTPNCQITKKIQGIFTWLEGKKACERVFKPSKNAIGSKKTSNVNAKPPTLDLHAQVKMA